MRKRFIIEIDVNETAKRTHAEWANLLEYYLLGAEIKYNTDLDLFKIKVLKKDPEKKK